MPDKQILIVAEVLVERLASPDCVVIDCRSDLADHSAGRRKYLAGHIPGAVFLDLDEELAGPVLHDTGRHPLPDVGELIETIGRAGISNSSSIVVYDAGNGGLAARAWWTLRWLGHDAVWLLDGGLARWKALGLPVEGGQVTRSAAKFDARMRDELVVTTRDLVDALPALHELRLLDARDAVRFRGEVEPIDPVAGHIPGARNLPYTDLVHVDGTWRPPAERARLLERVLGTDRSVPWTVMCGSGVTACHLAIAGIEAGYCEPRLYVGSWSEWIRDPDRPIGLGEGG